MTALLLLFGSLLQDVPDHPDKLQFPELAFKVPDAAAMRAVLSNGTVAFVLEDRELPLVKVSILVRGGGFWEPKGKEGLASMTGSLMRTAGTASRSPEQLDEDLDFIAADLSVGVGETSGSAELNVLAKDLDRGLELLLDVLKNPAFRQDKIDLRKAQTLEQLKARNDSTASIERREVDLLMYGASFPLNRHPTQASIDSIAREDLLAFHRAIFHADNLMIAASGDFDRAEMIRKLEALAAQLPRGKRVEAEVPAVSGGAEPGVYCFHKEGKQITQGRVRIGHLGVDIRHPDVHAIRVMNYILGGGSFSSRLTQKVRSDEGLAYSVGSGYTPGALYPGTFVVAFQSKNESCLYGARLCLDILKELRDKGPTQEEVQAAVAYFLDAFPAAFSSSFQTVTTFASAEMNGYPKDYYTSYRARISKVTAEDVRRAARTHCRPEELVILFVGNVPAIKGGDGKHPVRIEEFGRVRDVPLPDPLSLERPAPGQGG